jgi:GxxExxY protein
MNADKNRLLLDELTSTIIACVYQVSNSLGCGFLEKVYENSLLIELKNKGLNARQQQSIQIKYAGVVVGDYVCDILVNDSVILEIKAVRTLDQSHQAQCMNYLKATNLSVCLLINFGNPKAEIKRIVNQF